MSATSFKRLSKVLQQIESRQRQDGKIIITQPDGTSLVLPEAEYEGWLEDTIRSVISDITKH